MKIALQILKEFWLPFLAAVGWTVFSLLDQTADKGTLRAAVTSFGPSFFLASWLVAQWYRVRKQQKVEAGLGGIEARVQQMLVDLDEKTKDIVGQISGGGSACYFNSISSNSVVNALLIHHGKYPLYWINARVVDLDIFDFQNHTPNALQMSETIHQFSDSIPGHARQINNCFTSSQANTRRSIFSSRHEMAVLRNACGA